jgi:hypothetical protein
MEANKTDNRSGQLQEGVGRINQDNTGHQNQEKETLRDISDIDQQEGDMSNGVLGGNLGSIDREKENNKQE